MTAGGRFAAVAAAALAAVAIGAASRAPWAASPADRGLLRLSWRAPSEVAEQCRPLSAEEKADLPVHMQVPEVCERRAVPYLLEVRIDGATIAADTIHGAGAREDRPITVFREIPVAVGERAIDIAFRQVVQAREPHETGDSNGDLADHGDDGDDEDDGDDDEADGVGHEEDVGDGDDEDDDDPVSLTYSESLTLGAREVALITFDPERRALIRVVSP
ncbi:MAG TPA: hypothetical protein VFM44_03980 [Gemmatimonadota bacterium]|nr:hypothetical protein [Gemmatimonadota bacterium]